MPFTAWANFNTALSSWTASTYHLRVHSSTGQTPHERFASGVQAIRHIEDPDKIAPLFYTRTERVVRKDGTVTLGKKLFEVPLSRRALSVELRYDPILCDPVEVWHKGSLHSLARRCDLHFNSALPSQQVPQTEIAYYMSSRIKTEAGDGELLDAIVSKWDAIENGTHRVRDVSMGEDACCVANPNAPATWSTCATSPSASTTYSEFKRKPKLRACQPGGAP